MAQRNQKQASRPVGSYILRIVEQRTLVVSLVYELHDIGAGTRRSFDSLRALEQHLARRHRGAGSRENTRT